jgi:hypothetical protein
MINLLVICEREPVVVLLAVEVHEFGVLAARGADAK